MRVYPKVSGLVAWNEKPLGTVISLFLSQSSKFCRHNPLCCFSSSVCFCCFLFRYRLSPETFDYTLVVLHTRAVSVFNIHYTVFTRVAYQFSTIIT